MLGLLDKFRSKISGIGFKNSLYPWPNEADDRMRRPAGPADILSAYRNCRLKAVIYNLLNFTAKYAYKAVQPRRINWGPDAEWGLTCIRPH